MIHYSAFVCIIYFIFKTVRVIKFYMWNILSLNYERYLNYVKKKKILHSSFSVSALCLNTFAKFIHRQIYDSCKGQTTAYLLKSVVLSLNPANIQILRRYSTQHKSYSTETQYISCFSLRCWPQVNILAWRVCGK